MAREKPVPDADLDEDPDEEPGSDDLRGVQIERLSNVGEWEMYRLVHEVTRFAIGQVALSAKGSSGATRYAVWRAGKDLEEPGSTGTVARRAEPGEWDDAAREDAIRQLLYRYEADLGVAQEQAHFQMEKPAAQEDDDDADDDFADEDE